MDTSIRTQREALKARLFPAGIPTLWCPPLTHYTAGGAVDYRRISAHLEHLAPAVKTFLMFGSTGDGWELSEAEMDALLDFFAAETSRLGIRILVGVLRPEAEATVEGIRRTADRLAELAGTRDPGRALEAAGVCGFTVCAARGPAVAQETMLGDFSRMLDLGFPTAIYQIPQITQNEFYPETFARLAERYSNLYLFKDTSGNDTVIKAKTDRSGIFAVRGGEGDYADWYPPEPDGLYDGFLLGSANCFAREHARMLALKDSGDEAAARALSDKVSRTVKAGLQAAAGLPFGNAFANSNKAFDHYFAHGKRAADLPPPMTHSGTALPAALVRSCGELLEREGLMPDSGYLEAKR